MPKISILIPVYNVEKYLRECLESAINQTEKDIEIICVDDASEDSSLKILQEYANRDRRIKLIKHAENMGLCKTRKDAVEIAIGKYILFLDSDDYISLNTCEYLFCIMEKEEYDFAQFGAEILAGEKLADDLILWVDHFMNPEDTSGIQKDILSACFVEHKFNCNLVNKIWKTELCKEGFAKLLDGKYVSAEDRYALFILSYYAKYVGIIKEKFYHYRLGVGVTGGNVLDIKRFESRCKGSVIVENVKQFLIHQCKFEDYKNEFFNLKDEILLDCIDCWLYKIEEKNARKCFELLLQYWDAQDVIKLIGSNYFEKQDLILKRINDKSKVAIYYRYVGYLEMDRVLLNYKKYFEEKGKQVLLITDENSPEEGDRYLECQLEHIFSAEKANWGDYQYRSRDIQKVLLDNRVERLVYLSPTSHIAKMDELTIRLSGCLFEMGMDEYRVDELNKIKMQESISDIRFLKKVLRKIKRGE